MNIQQLGVALSCAALVLIAAGCCFCGDDGPKCDATLKYTKGDYSKDEPFIGKGRATLEKDAIVYACQDYCYTADKDFDDAYMEWVEKEANAAHKERYKDDVRKGKEWIPVTDSTMRREQDLCVDRCSENARKKKKGLSVKTVCPQPAK